MQLSHNTLFADSIAAELNSINNELHVDDLELAKLKTDLVAKSLEVETIEERIKVQIAFDTTLTNERQREAATVSERRKNDTWVSYTTDLIPKLKEQVTTLDAARNFKYRKYSILLAYLKSANQVIL